MKAWLRRKSKSTSRGAAVISKVNKSFDACRVFDVGALDSDRKPLGTGEGSRWGVPGSCWSSISASAGSDEDTLERGPNCRLCEQEKIASMDVSPRRGQANLITVFPTGTALASQQQRVPCDGGMSPRSPVPGSGAYRFSHSPTNLRVLVAAEGKLDDLRSPSHPLPLPPSSPLSPALPSVEPNWKKGRTLGSGAFGRVYAGFNSKNGWMCAIKEVEAIAGDPNSKESLKQLNQEINLLSQLSHPNIVQYYGSELNDDGLAVYLEYIPGGSLQRLVQDYGPLNESLIRSYVTQILFGLAYLHGRNCVHRDIKGANILVGPNGVIKLADFGMARHTSSCASVCSFKGSPFWMAPEVVAQSKGYGLAVDVWSLGCTIIEMATAKPPWSQCTEVQALFKLANSREIPEVPDHLSKDAKNFLRLCLQREPSARPTAMQLMEHPFVGYVEGTRKFKATAARDVQLSSNGVHLPSALDLMSNLNAGCSSRRCNQRVMPGSNKSLPVSPCSSSLRQAVHTNISCCPSPPHQELFCLNL